MAGVPYERPTTALRALVTLRARIQLPPSLPFVRRPRRLRTRERLGSTKIQDGGVTRSSCKCETEEAFINFELSEKSKIIR